MFITNDQKRGSVLITAIIFAAVLSLVLTSLLSYTNHVNSISKRNSLLELAMHLAESGIEIGMNDLNNGQVVSNFWKRENLSYDLGAYSADLDLAIIQDSIDPTIYEVYSIVSVPFGGDELNRSVSVRVKIDSTTTTTVTNDSTYGSFPYAIIANDITIQHGNNEKRPLFASYSSDLVSNPVFGISTGYDVSIVSPSSANGAIDVNNALVNGILNSGGGSIAYDSGRTNSNQLDQNLWLSMSADDSYSGINTEGLQTSFNGSINDPEYPDTTSYLAPAGQSEVSDEAFWSQNDNQISFGVEQNFWQNGSGNGSSELFSANGNDRTIGKSGEETVLTTPSITLQNSAKLTIKGDVTLYVKRNFNIHGDIEFESDATLHLIAKENNHFTGSSDNVKPIQFRLTPYVDLSSANPSGPNVQFNNTDRIGVVINAPYSKVSTGGQGNGNFDYMGAIIANSFECPNGVRFFYDVTLADGDTDDVQTTTTDTVTDAKFSLIDWSEVSANTTTTLLLSYGVDV